MLPYTQKAIYPRLVYENTVQEYFKIWCNISQTLGSVIHKNASSPMKLATKEINYPSMAVQVVAVESFVVFFPKSVTNVWSSQFNICCTYRERPLKVAS
ncbi:hypothetical protein Hanom_Chr12g01148621 [Helianthus anomalus]